MDYTLEYTQKGVDYWWRLLQDDKGDQRQLGTGIIPLEYWEQFISMLGFTKAFTHTLNLVERN